MSTRVKFPSVVGETYGSYCDRMEATVHQLIKAKDLSEDKLLILGYIAMEAPADFDYGQLDPPMKKIKNFLASQNEKVKESFREACRAHSNRFRADRIKYLTEG